MDIIKAMRDAQQAIMLSRAVFGVDTTGFAQRSRSLLLSNVHQGQNGFIGNKRYTDLGQSSTAITRSLGVGTRGIPDGTPIPWYVKPSDQGFVMQPLGDPNAKVNLGLDKAFADYVSTIGVTEANKLKNPLAYQQAQREFAKRVNIRPIDNYAKQ
jgi:hypothetical protein